MMTLPQLYERLSSLPMAGYFTNDSRFDKGFIYSIIHSARAQVIQAEYKINKQIHPSWLQSVEFTALKQEQVSGCFSRFTGFPQLIPLNGVADGGNYFGSVVENQLFRQVNDRATFAAMQYDPVMRAGRRCYVLIDGDTLEVYYKDNVKKLKVAGIFADPTKVPTYNIDYSLYPVDPATITKMEAYLMQTNLRQYESTPIDRVDNGRDDTAQPVPR